MCQEKKEEVLKIASIQDYIKQSKKDYEQKQHKQDKEQHDMNN